MSAPVVGNVRLPDDSANTGKKIQTQSETIGADIVHAHYFVTRSRRKLVGIYNFGTALQSVQAAAQDAVATGFLWWQLPAGATVRARLRHLSLAFSCLTEVDHLTTPRVVLARFTFTGTASGANVAAALRHSLDTAMASFLRTAVTGMTVTLGNVAFASIVPALLLTTSGLVFATSEAQEFRPTDEEDYLDIAPGEGFVLYQPDAGTTTDGRRFTVRGRIDEYDNS